MRDFFWEFGLVLGGFSVLLHSLYVFGRFGVQDIPNERSLHQEPIKKSGGIFFILLFLLASSIWFFELSGETSEENSISIIFVFLTGVSIFCLIGFLDDLYSLSAKFRLVIEFLIIGILLYLCPPSLSFAGWLLPSWLGLPFFAITIVFGINLVNFMDGMDWYVLMAILFAYLFLSSSGVPISPDSDFRILFFLLILSLFGFAIWNFPQAKLFMGDSGSLGLGFFLLVSPWLFKNNKQDLVWDCLDLFYLFPLFWWDGIMVILKRLWRKETVFAAHREHLYQMLAGTKLGKRGSLVLLSLANLSLFLELLFLREIDLGRNLGWAILFFSSGLCYFCLWLLIPRKNLA